MAFRLTPVARWAALASVAVASVALVPGLASADDDAAAPPSNKITLSVKTVNGSGCPAGTATVTPLADNTGFKISYANFRAEDGGDAAATDGRKNCQVNLDVHIPTGFTFAVASANYVGLASLQAGTTAVERSNYYYQGSSANNWVEHTVSGPVNGTWRATDVTAGAELVWSPCGQTRNLNINTELRVDAGTSSTKNWISLKSSDGEVYTLVNFEWKSC
jgi:Domain of unknown function (DUF4360)